MLIQSKSPMAVAIGNKNNSCFKNPVAFKGAPEKGLAKVIDPGYLENVVTRVESALNHTIGYNRNSLPEFRYDNEVGAFMKAYTKPNIEVERDQIVVINFPKENSADSISFRISHDKSKKNKERLNLDIIETSTSKHKVSYLSKDLYKKLEAVKKAPIGVDMYSLKRGVVNSTPGISVPKASESTPLEKFVNLLFDIGLRIGNDVGYIKKRW